MPTVRLEPTRLSTQEPKSCTSTNSAKSAYLALLRSQFVYHYYVPSSCQFLVARLKPIAALGSTSSLNNSFRCIRSCQPEV